MWSRYRGCPCLHRRRLANKQEDLLLYNNISPSLLRNCKYNHVQVPLQMYYSSQPHPSVQPVQVISKIPQSTSQQSTPQQLDQFLKQFFVQTKAIVAPSMYPIPLETVAETSRKLLRKNKTDFYIPISWLQDHVLFPLVQVTLFKKDPYVVLSKEHHMYITQTLPKIISLCPSLSKLFELYEDAFFQATNTIFSYLESYFDVQKDVQFFVSDDVRDVKLERQLWVPLFSQIVNERLLPTVKLLTEASKELHFHASTESADAQLLQQLIIQPILQYYITTVTWINQLISTNRQEFVQLQQMSLKAMSSVRFLGIVDNEMRPLPILRESIQEANELIRRYHWKHIPFSFPKEDNPICTVEMIYQGIDVVRNQQTNQIEMKPESTFPFQSVPSYLKLIIVEMVKYQYQVILQYNQKRNLGNSNLMEEESLYCQNGRVLLPKWRKEKTTASLQVICTNEKGELFIEVRIVNALPEEEPQIELDEKQEECKLEADVLFQKRKAFGSINYLQYEMQIGLQFMQHIAALLRGQMTCISKQSLLLKISK